MAIGRAGGSAFWTVHRRDASVMSEKAVRSRMERPSGGTDTALPEEPALPALPRSSGVLVTSAEHYGAELNRNFDYLRYLDALAEPGVAYAVHICGGAPQRHHRVGNPRRRLQRRVDSPRQRRRHSRRHPRPHRRQPPPPIAKILRRHRPAARSHIRRMGLTEWRLWGSVDLSMSSARRERRPCQMEPSDATPRPRIVA